MMEFLIFWGVSSFIYLTLTLASIKNEKISKLLDIGSSGSFTTALVIALMPVANILMFSLAMVHSLSEHNKPSHWD